jgi:hypothetical protein
MAALAPMMVIGDDDPFLKPHSKDTIVETPARENG